MIEKCTEIVSNWLIKNEVIEEADKDLYSYAVYSLFMSVSPLILAIALGLCVGNIARSIVIVIPFVFIRKFGGGYHANHAWFCLLSSCLILFLCIMASFYVQHGLMLTIVTIIATISLVYFSPIEHENRILTLEECRLYKKTTIILVCIFVIIANMLALFNLYTYSVCVSIGIILSAGLQLPCVFKSLKKTKND